MTDGRYHGARHYISRCSTDSSAQTLRFTLKHGRERDVLDALIRSGETGCSFFDMPAPRWAASVHKLRKRGIEVKTIRESHGGEYPGTHARYFLISDVTRVSEDSNQ